MQRLRRVKMAYVPRVASICAILWIYGLRNVKNAQAHQSLNNALLLPAPDPDGDDRQIRSPRRWLIHQVSYLPCTVCRTCCARSTSAISRPTVCYGRGLGLPSHAGLDRIGRVSLILLLQSFGRAATTELCSCYWTIVPRCGAIAHGTQARCSVDDFTTRKALTSGC